MGKRGPAPKPTRIKVLNGNPGHRPLNTREPMPKRGRPVCPAWLDDEAKTVWRKLVPELDRLGLLTVVDDWMLAGFCQACAELKQATETLRKDGRYTQNAAGTQVSHPAVSQQRSALKAVMDFASRFGLDPSSRTKLSAPAPESDADDDFERPVVGKVGG